MIGAVWTGLLGAVYLAMIGTCTLVDVATALVIGFAFSFVRPSHRQVASNQVLLVRWLALPRLLVAFAIEVVRGSFEVLWVLIGRKSWRTVGMVEVPVGERSPAGVIASGLALTATPGSILVEVDEQRSVLLVSAIDASDPERVRADLERFYQRHQRQVVP